MCTPSTVSFGKGGTYQSFGFGFLFFLLTAGNRFSRLQLDLKAGRLIQHCFEPEKHIHETLCGLRVRSESEILIINSPYDYGIPVDYERILGDYERKLLYAEERGVYFRADFTFDLYEGRKLIREQPGLLPLDIEKDIKCIDFT